MDLLALGTPVIDLFARASDADLKGLGVKKGATSYFSAKKVAELEQKLGKRVKHCYPGDNARNVCEGFAALSGFCGFAGAIGSDSAGGQFESNLAECGIAPFLQRKKGSTGRIIALVTPDKQRTFLADLGVSEKCTSFEAMAVKSSRMFYVSTITLVGKKPCARLAIRYIEAFRKAKKPVAISVENPPMVHQHRALLLSMIRKYADVLFLNKDEAESLLGRDFAGKLLLLKTRVPIYLKLGAAGSALYLGCKRQQIAPLEAEVMDTTGAGDAYAAGALYGLSRGYSPLSSGKIGCFLATKVVGKLGAGIPLRHIRLPIGKKRGLR